MDYKYEYKEDCILLFSFLLLIMGAAIDNIKDICHCVFLFDIKDIKTLMLTILQVHATIATLGIALLSIITGRFDHMVDGIEITNFIVNKRNKMLNQKNVIFIIIGSVVLSLVSITLGCFGIAFGAFFCAIIFLVFEIKEMWLVFKDDKELSLMLKRYIKAKYKSNDDFFVKYLCVTYDTDISSWSNIDSERYKNNVLDIWKMILENVNNQEELDKYSANYTKSIKGLLEKGNASQRHIAVDYLLEVYKEYSWKKRPFSIHIFADVSDSLYRILTSLDEDALHSAIVLLPKVVLDSSYNMEHTKDEQ